MKYVYVARTECGCCIGVCDPDPILADGVAEFIRKGLIVDRVDWPTYKEILREDTFMDCPHWRELQATKEKTSRNHETCIDITEQAIIRAIRRG